MQCRVCRASITALLFHSAPRSVIGVTRPIDAALNVYACERCGHGQSDDIDFDRFYDRDYRFQLTSLEHDQLHAVVNAPTAMSRMWKSWRSRSVTCTLLRLVTTMCARKPRPP